MEGAVAKLILDSLDNSETSKGTMSDIFQNYVDSMKQKEESVTDEKEIILAKKLKYLRSCEEKQDLGWFDYDSWNSFPKALKDTFLERVESLYYGGVFFQYSKLVEIENEIWCHLTPSHMVTVLKDSNNFHLVCVGDEDMKYVWLGIQAMQKVQRDFRSRTIRSIGKTAEGRIVSKLKVEEAG